MAYRVRRIISKVRCCLSIRRISICDSHLSVSSRHFFQKMTRKNMLRRRQTRERMLMDLGGEKNTQYPANSIAWYHAPRQEDFSGEKSRMPDMRHSVCLFLYLTALPATGWYGCDAKP
jgi:hypothetical protein